MGGTSVSRLSGRMELAFGVLEVQPWGGGARPSGCDYHTGVQHYFPDALVGSKSQMVGAYHSRGVWLCSKGYVLRDSHCGYSRGSAKLQRCLSRLPGRVFAPGGVAIKGAYL